MHEAEHTADSTGLPLLSLTERMRVLRQDNAGPDPMVVEEVVRAVIDTMSGRLSQTEAKLLEEIAGLGRIIEEAKDDIAEVSRDAISGSHIPSATGELDAIVEHTALATNSILESCEMLDGVAASLDPAQADILRNATTQIYEACSFQDITGQRITKIVKALQAIEAKVNAMAGGRSPSDGAAGPARDKAPAASASNPASLLNGPALPHEAMDQDDIDKLLADF